jgi:beta-xylosidase
VFRIGVAVGERPEGPFRAEPEPIRGSFSIDPAVFTDEDGASYLYFGGIWGGQLQRWRDGRYDPEGRRPTWGRTRPRRSARRSRG